jgi:peptidoglycan/xylan/chitin deacetylase (PgdA/CDA1 family)
MYFVKTPLLLKKCYPRLVWDSSNSKKKLFLTFDDGPTAGVTAATLDLLKSFEAKATFFCLGKNMLAHPAIVKRTLEEGHTIGNHSFAHANGWKTSTENYIKGISSTEQLINKHYNSINKASQLLFRPPYGRIKKKQINALKEKQYDIIMWDVLSGDFDTRCSKENCASNVIHSAVNGSIIVFHDSLKAADTMLFALQKTLTYFKAKGYTFEVL